MDELSRFRIYYAAGPETESEEIEVEALSEAVRRAEARRTRSCADVYFEIWQGENVLFTSNDRLANPV